MTILVHRRQASFVIRHSSSGKRQQVARLVDARPNSQTRTEAEGQEALADALAMERRDRLLEDAVEARRRELVAERERMQDQMQEVEGAQPDI